MKKKKKMIRVEIGNINLYDFECSVDQAIARLNQCKTRYSAYTNLGLELLGNKDDGFHLFILGDRLESDKEFQRRCKAEEINEKNARQQTEQEKIERATLKALIKKYGVPQRR